MIRLYYISSEKFKDVKKILEENPYADDSFAHAGYMLKDSKDYGFKASGYYIYVDTDEAFIKKADAKLKGLADIVEGKEFDGVKAKIEEEQNNAISGFGSIFGG
jgi:hypothetical protein